MQESNEEEEIKNETKQNRQKKTFIDCFYYFNVVIIIIMVGIRFTYAYKIMMTTAMNAILLFFFFFFFHFRLYSILLANGVDTLLVFTSSESRAIIHKNSEAARAIKWNVGKREENWNCICTYIHNSLPVWHREYCSFIYLFTFFFFSWKPLCLLLLIVVFKFSWRQRRTTSTRWPIPESSILLYICCCFLFPSF